MSGAIKAVELEEEVDDVESKPSEKPEPKVIEEKVVGKIFSLPARRQKYGFITRNDATDSDEKVYFRSEFGIYTPGFEVEFDLAETEQGKREAVNVKILDTQENKLLEVNVVKHNAERVKKDVARLRGFERDILAEGVKAHVLALNGAYGFLERDDAKGKLWFSEREMYYTDAEGVQWNQRLMEGDAVLCDVTYKYKGNNYKREAGNNFIACNIRGLDGGPHENSFRIKSGKKKNTVDEDKTEEVKTDKVKVKPQEKKATKKVAPLQRTTIENGVDAFLKMLKLSDKAKKDKIDLLGDDEEEAKLFIQISGIKVPLESDTMGLKATLPHPYLTPDAGILLIVKDLEKGLRVDHEDSLRFYTEMLKNANVDLTDINVMPFRQLRTEFIEHSTKKHLADSYEKVLCDKNLMHILLPNLGVYFYKKKKLPIKVCFAKEGKELKEEIAKKMRTTCLPIINKGLSATAHVARVGMDQQQIVENIEAFIKAVNHSYPGGWINVRSVALMTGNGSAYGTRSLLLYTSLLSGNDVGYVETQNLANHKVTMVTDELSTIPGAEVTVLRNGEVRVRRTRDPEWDEIEGANTLVEYMDEDADQKMYLHKMTQLMKLGKRAHEEDTQDQEVPAGGSTGKKKKKNDEDSENESDLELDEMETEYMRKIAEEEEEIERQEEENMNKLKEEDKKNGEDVEDGDDLESEVEDFEDEESEEEESEIDDDIEVENMVSSEEEGSGEEDDELLMKRQEEADISEDEAPKKKKSKKQLKKEAKLKKQESAAKKSKSKSSKSPAAAKKSPKGVKGGKIQKKKK